MDSLLELAKRVKRGVRLLDEKIPNWRRTMKRHAATFNLSSVDHCVLGTLEHYNGRMRVLHAKRAKGQSKGYCTGKVVLGIGNRSGRDFGFDAGGIHAGDEFRTLSDLWRAEFEA